MSRTAASPLDRLLGRLDNLDTTNLTILVQRLARERALLETVFNTVREGILVIDDAGVIEYANTSAGQLVGFSQDEVGQAVLWKLIPDLARSIDLGPGGRVREGSTATRDLELTYPELRYVRLYLAPVETANATAEEGDTAAAPGHRFAVILSDVTQEMASVQKLIATEKVSSLVHLAAGVAHELGNPLNSLTIHLQLMGRELARLRDGMAAGGEGGSADGAGDGSEDGAGDGSEDRAGDGSEDRDEDEEAAAAAAAKLGRSLGVCTREVSRLDGIISNFLGAVRPDPPDLQDIDLIATLEEVLGVQGPELADAGIEVDVEVDARPPIVSADPNQIKQVYFNLIKNAQEAMAGGGTIKVQSRADHEFVTVAIGDNGEGIQQEHLGNVFQPYFSTKKGGHGLGMLIVQRIMHEHGGRIGIDSRPGEWTVVTLQFPRKHRRLRMLSDSATATAGARAEAAAEEGEDEGGAAAG